MKIVILAGGLGTRLSEETDLNYTGRHGVDFFLGTYPGLTKDMHTYIGETLDKFIDSRKR